MTRAELIEALEKADGPSRGKVDMTGFIEQYMADRQAVRKFAAKFSVSIQAIYWRMDALGIERRKGGDASKGTQAGKMNPNWIDGTTVRKDGYILQRVNGQQVFQHRLVAEKKLGRPLLKEERVHHVNGNKSDNRPENIEVLPSHSDHMKLHCSSEIMRARGALGLAKKRALKAGGEDDKAK